MGSVVRASCIRYPGRGTEMKIRFLDEGLQDLFLAQHLANQHFHITTTSFCPVNTSRGHFQNADVNSAPMGKHLPRTHPPCDHTSETTPPRELTTNYALITWDRFSTPRLPFGGKDEEKGGIRSACRKSERPRPATCLPFIILGRVAIARRGA